MANETERNDDDGDAGKSGNEVETKAQDNDEDAEFFVNYQARSKYVFLVSCEETLQKRFFSSFKSSIGRSFRGASAEWIALILFGVILASWLAEDTIVLNYVLPWFVLVLSVYALLLRSTSVLRKIVKTFDSWFFIVNALFWILAQGSIFDFDTRILALVFAALPIFTLLLSADAMICASRDVSPLWNLALLLVFLSLLLFSFGHVFADSTFHRIQCSLVEFECSTNITAFNDAESEVSIDDRERWSMEAVFSLAAFCDFRVALLALYVAKYLTISSTQSQCMMLTDRTRKEIVSKDTVSRVMSSAAVTDANTQHAAKKKISRKMSRAVHALDDASEACLSALDDDAMVYVYFPGTGPTIRQGLDTSVLYFLSCGHVELTTRVNDFLERRFKAYGQITMVLTWIITFLGLCEVLPYEAVYTVILAAGDPLRVFLKMNVSGARFVLRHFNFWLPFVGSVVFSIGLILSLDWDPGAVLLAIVFLFTLTINCLMGDADLSRRCLTEPEDITLYIIFVVLLNVFVFLVSIGASPRGSNHIFRFEFWNNDVAVGSVSLMISFALYPTVFILKFIYTILRDPWCSVICSVSYHRIRVAKRDVRSFLSKLKNEDVKREIVAKAASKNSYFSSLFANRRRAKISPEEGL